MTTETDRYELWRKFYSDPNGTKTTWHLVNVKFIEGYSVEFSGTGSGELYLVSTNTRAKTFLANSTTNWEVANLLQMIAVPHDAEIKLLNARGEVRAFLKLKVIASRKTEGTQPDEGGDGKR